MGFVGFEGFCRVFVGFVGFVVGFGGRVCIMTSVPTGSWTGKRTVSGLENSEPHLYNKKLAFAYMSHEEREDLPSERFWCASQNWR